MDQQMLQVFVMVAAAELTAAAMHTNATLPTDPTNPVSDAQKATDLGVWEVYRIFYSALIQTMSDNADWPLPPSKTPGLGSSLTGTLAAPTQAVVKAIASGQPAAAVLSLIQSLMTAVQAQQPSTSGSSPAMGTTQAQATATPAPTVGAALPIK